MPEKIIHFAPLLIGKDLSDFAAIEQHIRAIIPFSLANEEKVQQLQPEISVLAAKLFVITHPQYVLTLRDAVAS